MPAKNSEKSKKNKESAKKLTQKEFEEKVIALAEKGLTAEKIGESLRKEGIHPREYEKKLSRILKEKGDYVHPDIKSLEEKLQRILTHVEKNRQNKRAIRDRVRVAAKLRRLKKYLKV
jgi:ribosomal protein S15P/S13E